MARHRAASDDSDQTAGQQTTVAQLRARADTGRHHRIDAELGPDPLAVHRSATPTVEPGRADLTDTGPVDLSGLPSGSGTSGDGGSSGVAVLTDSLASPGSVVLDGPAGAPGRRPRAGRDLPAAIGVSLGLGALIVICLVFYRGSFVLLVMLTIGYGSYELRHAIATVEARPPLVPLIIGGGAIAATAWLRGENGLIIATLLTAAAVAVWRLGDGAAGYLRDVASSMLVLTYLPVLAAFAVLLARPADGASRVIVFIATVVCSDTGGYAAGVWLGRHPLAPGISRAKTWEGTAGSVVACSVAGVLFLTLVFHQPWWTGLVFGAAIAVTATLGDLGESMIKRDLGVKDMGRLLPGHGGLMDRLDSLLPCAAVAYLLLTAFAPP